MSAREVLATKKRFLSGFSSVLKSGLAISAKKRKCLEKLEESLASLLHYIQLFICPSLFWNGQYYPFHLTIPGPIRNAAGAFVAA